MTKGLRIKSIDVHPDVNVLLIILNTGRVIQEQLSNYPKLRHAPIAMLQNMALIGNGTGIHWPEPDEDLSLKGFLRDAIKNQVVSTTKTI